MPVGDGRLQPGVGGTRNVKGRVQRNRPARRFQQHGRGPLLALRSRLPGRRQRGSLEASAILRAASNLVVEFHGFRRRRSVQLAMQQQAQLTIELDRLSNLTARCILLHQAAIRALPQSVHCDHAAQIADGSGAVALAHDMRGQPFQRFQEGMLPFAPGGKHPLLAASFQQRAAIERHRRSPGIRFRARQRGIERDHVHRRPVQIQAQRVPGR